MDDVCIQSASCIQASLPHCSFSRRPPLTSRSSSHMRYLLLIITDALADYLRISILTTCILTSKFNHFHACTAFLGCLTETLLTCCRGFSGHWQQRRWYCLHGCTTLPLTSSQPNGRCATLLQCTTLCLNYLHSLVTCVSIDTAPLQQMLRHDMLVQHAAATWCFTCW